MAYSSTSGWHIFRKESYLSQRRCFLEPLHEDGPPVPAYPRGEGGTQLRHARHRPVRVMCARAVCSKWRHSIYTSDLMIIHYYKVIVRLYNFVRFILFFYMIRFCFKLSNDFQNVSSIYHVDIISVIFYKLWAEYVTGYNWTKGRNVGSTWTLSSFFSEKILIVILFSYFYFSFYINLFPFNLFQCCAIKKRKRHFIFLVKLMKRCFINPK